MKHLRVRDLMTERVHRLSSEDDLYTLRELMREHNVRHVPVVDGDGEVIGVVSLRDYARATRDVEYDLPLSNVDDFLHSTQVGDIMTTEVATVEPDADLRDAARLMFDCKFGCLPVVVGTRLAGILTEADFVRHMAR